MRCGAWGGWTRVSRAEGRGGRFTVWCAVFLFASTRSFPDKQEQRDTGASPHRLCLDLQLSVSPLMASGDESGAAGAGVLEGTCYHRSVTYLTSQSNLGSYYVQMFAVRHAQIYPLLVQSSASLV